MRFETETENRRTTAFLNLYRFLQLYPNPDLFLYSVRAFF